MGGNHMSLPTLEAKGLMNLEACYYSLSLLYYYIYMLSYR